MNMPRRITPALAVLAVLIMTLGACGSTDGGDTGEVPLGDTTSESPGAAAGACLEGDPNCNDTGDMSTPGPPPLDEPSDRGNDGSEPAVGPILTVAEALASDGLITVQGFLVADETGAMLCEALAESYPPQCGGASVPVVDYEEIVDVPLQSAEGVTWTDRFLTLTGELSDGVFVVDPTVIG